MKFLQILLFLLFQNFIRAYHSIDAYGAVPFISTNDVAHNNTAAMWLACEAANKDPNDREVLLPANKTYYFFNMYCEGVKNVTLRIDGTYKTSDNITEWCIVMGCGDPIEHMGSLNVLYAKNFTLTGSGTVDGQGYEWWNYTWSNPSQPDQRPYLVYMIQSKDVEISNLYFKNSPYWHIHLQDMSNVHIHDIDIHVDVDRQKEILTSTGNWNEELDLPIFPLNTDGIDPSGADFLIENVKMELFDDAVAVKPSSYQQDDYANCSQNMMIRNVTTLFTVGMAIGSLTNSPNTNCIRNITFENITMFLPLKGIHVKTNPNHTSGIGIIDGITYRNMQLIGSVWMPVYIGPQQQQQPGTSGTGCSWFYPLVDKCPTNPNVQISNILLENITIEASLLWPGTINCDPVTKCKNLTFTNVRNTGPFLLMPIYDYTG